MGWYEESFDAIPTPRAKKQSGDEYKSFCDRATAKPKLQNNAKTIIVLFSGGGGVECGAIEAGIKPIISVEFDPSKPELSAKLADMHEHNFSAYDGKLIRKTVQQVAEEDFLGFPETDPDFLHASPVCSNFSSAKGINAIESDVDISAALAVAQAIEIFRPKVFTLENVPDYQKSKSFEIIKKELLASGYNVSFDILNFAEYGLPQARKRLILRASLTELPPLPPKCDRIVGWYEAIQHLISSMPDSLLSKGQQEALEKFLVNNEPCPLLIERTGARNKSHRIKPASLPVTTLTRSLFTDQRGANRNKWADIWLPDGTVKSVSIAAAAVLQGFPDWYEFSTSSAIAGSAIGYSVPPSFATQLFRSFLNDESEVTRWNKSGDSSSFGERAIDSERASAETSEVELKQHPEVIKLSDKLQQSCVQPQIKEIPHQRLHRRTDESLQYQRHHLDFYESPHWFVTDTMRFVDVSGVVGECCSGAGAIATLLAFYPQVTKVWTNDIDPNKSADYHEDAIAPWNFPKADWIITNPPYGALAAPIIKNAYAHAKRGIIMFLRHSWDEPCDDRADWLAAHPLTRKLTFPRYKFRKDELGKRWATDSSTISAFIWDKQIPCQPSLTRPASDIWGFHDNPENAPSVDAIAQWIQIFDVQKSVCTSTNFTKTGNLQCLPVRKGSESVRWVFKYGEKGEDGKWRSRSKHVPKASVKTIQQAQQRGESVEKILASLMYR